MKWYLKALIQNAFDALPQTVAQPLYYGLQRKLGELRHPRYRMRFEAAIDVARLLKEHRDGVGGLRLLEVGTGRTVDLPMALWLMGADEVVTIDITRLLRAELLPGAIHHLSDHWGEYRERFVEVADPEVVDARFEELRGLGQGPIDEVNLPRILRAMRIDYRAPADATQITLGDESVDVVVTFVVLQHVPPEPMEAILRATRPMLKKSGCMIHVANTSDHFSFADPSLSALHFLRWSERQWDWIAGNRYMYQNRMRADDYYALFRRAGLRVAQTEEVVDEDVLRELRSGLALHPDWQGREPERDAVLRFTALLERDDA